MWAAFLRGLLPLQMQPLPAMEQKGAGSGGFLCSTLRKEGVGAFQEGAGSPEDFLGLSSGVTIPTQGCNNAAENRGPSG